VCRRDKKEGAEKMQQSHCDEFLLWQKEM
jgi:hypothetical protein